MFVGCGGAFGTVGHAVLWKTLLDNGTPRQLVWLLERLCSGATGVVGVEDGRAGQFPFEGGFGGVVLCPPCFSMPVGAILRRVQGALDGGSGSIVDGGVSAMLMAPRCLRARGQDWRRGQRSWRGAATHLVSMWTQWGLMLWFMVVAS